MIEKDKLKDYARKLMFEMNEEEYETLQKEFEVILKQIALIDNIKGIKDVKPMTFPYIAYKATFREDEVKQEIDAEEVLSNTIHQYQDQVRVPKVVE
ncbi:MAG: Asp-tRNA(Asn)/Glu-tRNA(Gln) amidotransferase subunit GatC [Bacilli bacterium]|nr:Asp-tRNA(Asn)/Glu-tRNA(Gln) amidotransferase subunit GatC [Bacilli bacterium]